MYSVCNTQATLCVQYVQQASNPVCTVCATSKQHCVYSVDWINTTGATDIDVGRRVQSVTRSMVCCGSDEDNGGGRGVVMVVMVIVKVVWLVNVVEVVVGNCEYYWSL